MRLNEAVVMIKRSIFLTLLTAALLSTPTAARQTGLAVVDVSKSTPQEVRDYHQQTLTMLKSNRYKLRNDERQKIASASNKALSTLASVEQWAQVSPADVATISDANALVAQTIASADARGKRLICERRAETGTNLRRVHCETVVKRDQDARAAQEALQDMHRRGTSGVDPENIDSSQVVRGGN